MVATTPTGRLEFVGDLLPRTKDRVAKILDSYGRFLETCDEDKATLETKFGETDFRRARFAEAKEFGGEISDLLHELGSKSELLRYLLV